MSNHISDANKSVCEAPRTNTYLTAILDADGFVDQSNCPQRWVNHSRELERELNAANERIKRLEEAGDALKAAGYFGGFNDAVDKWINVKEAKL